MRAVNSKTHSKPAVLFKVPPRNTLYILLISFVGILTCANSLLNGFVGDDKGLIYSSPFTHPLYSLPYIFVLSGQPVYRPFFFLYMDIISILSQGNPMISHAIQVGLHIACAILLYAIFKKFLKEPIALILSLIFVVHPVNTEAVVYIAAAGDILLFLFGMLALRGKTIFHMALFLFLSLLVNEAGISWILIAISYLILFNKTSFKRSTFLVIPLILYGFLKLFIAKSTFHNFGYVPVTKLSFLGRLMTMPNVFFYYLKTVFYPANLAVSQLWVVTKVNIPDFIIPLTVDILFVAGVIAAGWYIFYRHNKLFRTYLFFSLWFVFGIAPYMQLIPAPDATTADRWFYLPFAGLLGMIGTFIQTVKLTNRGKIVGVVVASIIILSLAGRTIIRNTNWHDGLTLYSHDVIVNPNFDLQSKLAGEFLNAGQLDPAMTNAQKALALEPHDIPALGTVALVYVKQNKPQLAIPLFQKLLTQDPTNYLGLTNLINAYLLSGDQGDAQKYTLEALKIYPNDESLLMFLKMVQQNPATLPQP